MSEPEAGDLVRQRHDKLAALRRRGLDPFGGRYPVSHWAGPLHARLQEATDDELAALGPVSLAGRVMTLRHHGRTCFAHLMDQTGRIQLYARADQLGDDYALFTDLDLGDFIGVTGEMMRTRTGELTVAVKAFTFLTKSLRPLPEKWHGLKDPDLQQRQRHLHLATDLGFRRVVDARARTLRAIRSYLDARGFVEVETPMLHRQPVRNESRRGGYRSGG